MCAQLARQREVTGVNVAGAIEMLTSWSNMWQWKTNLPGVSAKCVHTLVTWPGKATTCPPSARRIVRTGTTNHVQCL